MSLLGAVDYANQETQPSNSEPSLIRVLTTCTHQKGQAIDWNDFISSWVFANKTKRTYENFSALVTHAPLLGMLQDYIIQYYPRCKKWDISKSNHLRLLIFKVFKNLPNKTVKKKKNPK